MAFQEISSVGALTPGANLWIIPDYKVSYWSRKVDWYLSFQVAKAQIHKSQQMSEPLKEIVEHCELPFKDTSLPDFMPLLITSQHNLPNKYTVKIEFQGSAQAWLKNIHLVWVNLQRPSLRVFLPNNVNIADVKKYWPVPETDSDISFVVDQ